MLRAAVESGSHAASDARSAASGYLQSTNSTPCGCAMDYGRSSALIQNAHVGFACAHENQCRVLRESSWEILRQESLPMMRLRSNASRNSATKRSARRFLQSPANASCTRLVRCPAASSARLSEPKKGWESASFAMKA